MRNIEAMIKKANGATGTHHELAVEWDDGEWLAAIAERVGESAEPITLESNWDVDCATEGATIEEALANLDEICSADFR